MIDIQLSGFRPFCLFKSDCQNVRSQETHLQNAMVPSSFGIPGANVISGATLTETVFAFPGMGKMLIDSTAQTTPWSSISTSSSHHLGIFAAMLGDILMTVLDPRIKLTNNERRQIMATTIKINFSFVKR